MLKRLSVRFKMTVALVLIASVSGLVAYIVPTNAFQPIAEVAIPKFDVTNRLTELVRLIQAETVSYVVFGEEHDLTRFEASIAELEEIRDDAQPFLQGNNEQAADFRLLFAQADEISTKSQEIVTAHGQTLTLLEDLEPLDDDASEAFRTLDAQMTEFLLAQDEADESLLYQVQLLGQFVEHFRIVQLETMEYVANGDPDALVEMGEALEEMAMVITEMETAVATDNSIIPTLIIELIHFKNQITTIANDTTSAHQQTLTLIDDLATVETEFDETILMIESQVLQAVEDSLVNMATAILVSAGLILLFAIVLGLLITNRVVIRPLHQLSTSAAKLGQGDLSERVPITRHDEIGQSGIAINQMAAQLQRNIDDLAQRIVELQRTKNNLETANMELEQFAYIAAHDLKSPLRAIANLAEWLQEDIDDSALTDETRNYLQLIHARVQRMEALIDGLRTYSRSGHMSDKPEEVNTHDVVLAAADLFAIPDTFSLQIAPDMPIFITYRQDFEQVFFQLISNAVKHHHQPNGKINVAWEDGTDFYQFTVSDDGPGISAEYHEKAMTIFQTLQSRDKVEGIGLGLPLAKKLIENRDGQINIESSDGQGTTIRFSWPKQIDKTD